MDTFLQKGEEILQGGKVDRQKNRKGNGILPAGCRDRTAVEFYDFLGNRKAETGATGCRGTGGVQPEELFKYPA